MNILVTGSAGFIGYHLSKHLCEKNYSVFGIDNLNDYYDTSLKEARLKKLSDKNNFKFSKIDLKDSSAVLELFYKNNFTHVVNFAAQAGVRFSIKNPQAYIDSNIIGFFNILEACKLSKIDHLVYASSSSVYGLNKEIPFSTKHKVDRPISLYAASKKSNELMAYTYSHLYSIPTTGLRFFTVYGPWGRPDMAYFKFTENILKNKPIDVYNFGKLKRDFTYIDDIIDGVIAVLEKTPNATDTIKSKNETPISALAPYKLYNIGNNKPVELLTFINIIEKNLGKKAKMKMLPMQQGDVKITYANIDDLVEDFNFCPQVDIDTGINKFVEWYLDYYAKK